MDGPLRNVVRTAWRRNEIDYGARTLLTETEVALTINEEVAAILTASPLDLEDLAIGYCVSNGCVNTFNDIAFIEIDENDARIELRVLLTKPPLGPATPARRKNFSGCDAFATNLSIVPVSGTRQRTAVDEILSPGEIMRAREAMAAHQTLKRDSCAAHAAAFWRPMDGLVALREDVACVNALDKLAGTLLQSDVCDRWRGVVLLSDAVSVQLVQKAAMLQFLIIVATGAPTTLAVKRAEEAGITLIAYACNNSFEIYSHPHRLSNEHIARIV
jgi:FdhD protein